MHWVTDAGGLASTGSVFPGYPDHEDGAERRAWRVAAAPQWERLLEMRARELVPGGRFVAALPASPAPCPARTGDYAARRRWCAPTSCARSLWTPRSVGEFGAWFATDADCLDYLEWLRWPSGFCCPSCGHDEGWRLSDRRFECARCRARTSTTAGTIFDRTRTPLTVWFAACWAFASDKGGVSALGLQRSLEIGSYQTAWTMLHRLRSVLVRPDREPLAGVVEVDETYIGGHEPGLSGGPCPGQVEPAHLPAYLDEFTFRFNRRRSHSRGLLFYRVLELAVAGGPLRYRDLIATRRPRSQPPRTPGGSGQPASLDRPPANRPWRTADQPSSA